MMMSSPKSKNKPKPKPVTVTKELPNYTIRYAINPSLVSNCESITDRGRTCNNAFIYSQKTSNGNIRIENCAQYCVNNAHIWLEKLIQSLPRDIYIKHQQQTQLMPVVVEWWSISIENITIGSKHTGFEIFRNTTRTNYNINALHSWKMKHRPRLEEVAAIMVDNKIQITFDCVIPAIEVYDDPSFIWSISGDSVPRLLADKQWVKTPVYSRAEQDTLVSDPLIIDANTFSFTHIDGSKRIME